MRLAVFTLFVACHPVDTTRVRVRGDGITLDLTTTADPEQVHLRWFDAEISPACDLEVVCRSADDPERLARALGHGPAVRGAVVGFLADTRYTCDVTARTGGRSVVATTSFRTEAAAIGTPEIEVEGEGWGDLTLFNTWRAGGGGKDHVLVIADDRGRVRWALPLGDQQEIGLEATVWEGRSLLVGGGGYLAPQRRTLSGHVPWSFPELPAGQHYHHDAAFTPHGTVLGLNDVHQEGPAGGFTGFRISERDPETDALGFEWTSHDAYAQGLLPRGEGSDPWHANGVVWIEDALGPGVLVSLPGIDRVLRIDPSDGRIVWQLGAGLDFALTDGAWFSYQHAPEWRDGRLLLHDNGRARDQTRVLELEVDQDARTATITWEWTKPDWFELIWGEADRLPDGTVLVTHGHCGFCGRGGSGPSSISVVDRSDGAIRWTLVLPDDELGLYRSERVTRDLLDLEEGAP